MPRFLSLLLAMVFSLASCRGQTVLDLRHDEAALKLKAGDIGFILDSPTDRLGELVRLHASAPYYAGLLVQDRGKDEQAAALFEAALDGTGRTRREAAGKLLRFAQVWDEPETRSFLARLESRSRPIFAEPAVRTLRAACLYRLRRFADLKALYGNLAPDAGPWDRAFLLLAASETEPDSGLPGQLEDFFLDQLPGEADQGAALEEARRWAWEELGNRLPELAGPAVAAAAAGRFSIRRLAYAEGLAHFREALAAAEVLFFRHLPLLGDLGRAFVFTNAQAEGLALFSDWNRRILEGSLDGKGLDISGIRYHILYYLARIQRSLSSYAEASEYFAQALDFASDPVQADACIWSILSISLQEQPWETAALIGRYSSRWNRDSYFADILDRLARYLVANRRWNSLAEVFFLIKNRSDGNSIAKYAYILGSALSEGLFAPDPDAGPAETAEGYLRVALGQRNASFYYPVLAALRLGETVSPVLEEESPVADKKAGENPSLGADSEFLQGFFRYGAANLAFDFVARDADRLSPDELRSLAAAFATTGRLEESIRTISYYAGRDGYRMQKQDLELYYPRAFTELVEAAAKEENLPRELLFGLIRTESAFSPGIRSWAGATGLTQLMGATAADMAGRLHRRGGPDYAAGGEIDLKDPEANIRLGAVYLRYLMDRTESPLMALLAYNGGIGRLRRWRRAEPALGGDLFLETVEYNETREYGRKVLAAAAAYGYLYYGLTMEVVFADTYK
jgi:soluble lytic murein transglycosylase